MPSVVCCALCLVCRMMRDVFVCCSLVVARWVLFVVCCLLFVVCCLWLLYGSVFVVCCLLFVVVGVVCLLLLLLVCVRS